MATSGNTELDEFIAKFSPGVAALAHALLAKARAQFPGAEVPVYDSYNALALGFGATDRVKDVIFSLAVMPRWVTLCFIWGVRLDDPKRLLAGTGTQVRHMRLVTPATFDSPDVQHLLAQALANAKPPITPEAIGGIVIKSISVKQRPRRPEG